MNVDLSGLQGTLSSLNSALSVDALAEEMAHGQRVAAAIARESAKRDATLVAGAEANIAQIGLIEQQLGVLREQNSLLLDNYEKLKAMYDQQVQANKDAKEDLRKSRVFNMWMMIIAIVAMFAAIAGPIATILVSR